MLIAKYNATEGDATAEGENKTTEKANKDSQLNLPGTEPEYKNDPKLEKELNKYKLENAKMLERMKEFEAKLTEIDKTEQEKKRMTEEEETKKLLEKGKYEDVMKKKDETWKSREEKYQSELTERENKLKEKTMILHQMLKRQELEKALSKYSLVKTDIVDARADAIEMLENHISIGADDKTIICNDITTGDTVTVDDMVKRFLEPRKHWIRNDSPAGGGSPKETKTDTKPNTMEGLMADFNPRRNNVVQIKTA